MSLSNFLHSELKNLDAIHLRRVRRTLSSPQAAEVIVDGKTLINFCSNDYLGLASHPDVIAAFKQGAERWGVGSGASHLVTGHMQAHEVLEEQLAAFTGREAALCFSTGFMANVGIVQTLCGRGDRVLEDRLNHASLIDGGLHSGGEFKRYAHKDMAALELQLREKKTGHTLVVTDAVFSMDGDIAPLPEMADLCAGHDAWLMVDDAHGFGVLGASGAGTCEQFGLNADAVPVLMCTLGKALGTYGAFAAGSRDLINYLLNTARPYIYSTAMPAAIACASSAALTVLQKEHWRRSSLRDLIAQFRTLAAQAGLQLMPSDTAIQPLLIGDNERALQLATQLRERGFLISAIRPPTVPAGSARLRITLSAAHSEAQIAKLVEALAELNIHTAD